MKTNILTLGAAMVGLILVGTAYYAARSPKAKAPQPITAQQTITSIQPNTFAAKVAEGTYTVIDLRTPEEITEGKIVEDALELDVYASDFEARLAALDRDTPYLLYCRSGNRSGQVLEKMRSLGFTQVHDLSGGKIAWEAAGKKLVVPEDTTAGTAVACDDDARICSDGTTVGRVGPDCEFAPCT